MHGQGMREAGRAAASSPKRKAENGKAENGKVLRARDQGMREAG
jgi:hypothetical protein